MTTNNYVITSNYLAPFTRTYTGTKEQPDVISVFIKWSRNPGDMKIADEQIVNALGHSPKNFLSALPRIQKAVEILFQELKEGTCFGENSEFWNAFKNFSRGIVQLVPFLGNAILYVHDLARIHFSTHPTLAEALSHQEGPIVGIAFDGKPIFTAPVSQLQSTFSSIAQNNENSISLVHFLWLGIKQRAFQNNSNMTTPQLAEQFRQLLTNLQSSHSTTST